MVEISAEARQYVTDEYAPGVAEYLLGGDGFRVQAEPGKENLSATWASFFADLVEHGYMRRSRTGRYWWHRTAPKMGWALGDERIPEDQPHVTHRESAAELMAMPLDQIASLPACESCEEPGEHIHVTPSPEMRSAVLAAAGLADHLAAGIDAILGG